MTHILIIHPVDPTSGVEDPDAFLQDLREIGLLDQKLEARQRLDSALEHTFTQGEKFLELVRFSHSHFVGTIQETANGPKPVPLGDSRHLSRLSLLVHKEPQFLGTANTLPPICPYCQYETEEPFGIVSDWFTNQLDFLWHCPRCERGLRIYELDWRRSSGFGKIALHVWDVWQGEAQPSQRLLDSLEEATGNKWTYFYYRS